MFRRPFILLILAAVALGGPYLAMETKFGQAVTAKVRQVSARGGGSIGSNWSDSTESDLNSHHRTESLWAQPEKHPHRNSDWMRHPKQSLAGGPFHDFREVLRFDITPAWVTARFSRVTTVLAESQLEGLRVPVVTGAKPDDLAGTITYYFTREHHLQRITLNGFTGDPKRLVSLMLAHYHLQPDHTLGPGGYSYGWNRQPSSLLKITPTPVVYADSPNARFTVFLEINQPSSSFGLSRAAADIVASARGTGVL